MNKNQKNEQTSEQTAQPANVKKRTYVKPEVEKIKVESNQFLMAASPNVGFIVSIEEPTEDSEDTDLLGAKQTNMWDTEN